MFPCPRGLKFNKGEKHNHSRPLNYQNIKKFIIKFTCTDPGIVSAKKDVAETFTLQLLITLLPWPTGSYVYYQVFPFSDTDVHRYWRKYGFLYPHSHWDRGSRRTHTQIQKPQCVLQVLPLQCCQHRHQYCLDQNTTRNQRALPASTSVPSDSLPRAHWASPIS